LTNRPISVLHDIHTATNDILKGFREMSGRAKPEIQPVILRLTTMHEIHAAEQLSELQRLRDTGEGDNSLQGTVNKAVVILRDWLADLDRDALPAVREGEESLYKEYSKAFNDGLFPADSLVAGLLKSQMESIASEIARLPLN
jgi:hypothetical protein